jgi:ElaB/YqjD/DUF883 family membrane-anchored ribosome-binding protein
MDTEPAGGGSNSTVPLGNRSAGELARMATHQVGESLARSKVKLSELQTAFTEKTRECMEQTDTYVHDNPWKAVGWAAGIGFALGLIMRRR